MTYELLQGAAIGAVMGASFILGRASTFKERGKLQAELTRLTDRDDHGCYVKAEDNISPSSRKLIEEAQPVMAVIHRRINQAIEADKAQARIESTKVARKPRKAKT